MIKLGFIPPYHLARQSLYFQTKNDLSMWKDISSDNDTIELEKGFQKKTNSCVYK